MRDTKDRILHSLTSLDKNQMDLVLKYINRLDEESKQKDYALFKQRALNEIRKALKGTEAIK